MVVLRPMFAHIYKDVQIHIMSGKGFEEMGQKLDSVANHLKRNVVGSGWKEGPRR